MPPLFVDLSWYNRVWLTEHAPPCTALLCEHAGLLARRLANAISALAAFYTSLLQQASHNSPSFL